MNVKSFEKKEKSTAELVVEVTAEEFDAAVNESFKRNKSRISVPGFRKGKAPRKIVEKMYGETVFYDDAFEMVLPTACAFGCKENDLRTIGYPDIEDVKVEDDKSVTVKYLVALYPEISISDYKGVEAEKPVVTVTDAEIDGQIEGKRLSVARLQTTERPACNGDTAVIDYEGYVDGATFDGGHGENYELVLGSNTFIPGFEAKMGGMRIGEERDLELTFPEQYHAENLAGKPVTFHVKLNDLKEKILPELDDEFAKDVSEFDTLAEYRDSIKEEIRVRKEAEAQNTFEQNVLERVTEKIEGDIPQAMYEDFIDNQLQNFSQSLSQYGMDLQSYVQMLGGTPEQFRESMRPNAEKQVKIAVAMEKIAQLENIEATDEQIEAQYEELAKRYGVDVEDVKKGVDKASVIGDIQMTTAMKMVVDSAVAVEPKAEEESPAEEAKSEETAE